MKYSEKVATSNATEIINEANNASSVEPTTNNNMSKETKVATSNANQTDNAVEIAVSEKENARVPYKTVNAIIDGEHKKSSLPIQNIAWNNPRTN